MQNGAKLNQERNKKQRKGIRRNKNGSANEIFTKYTEQNGLKLTNGNKQWEQDRRL